MKLDLKMYGLSDRFKQEASLYEGLFLARVTEQHRELYKVVCQGGQLTGCVSGKLAYEAGRQTGFPVVGDWVIIDRLDDSGGNAIIHHILSRKSMLSRQAAGTEKVEQPMAANIDIIFICMSLNADFNLRRVERYLAIAWESMATPVIVLTKSDLCENLKEKIDELSVVSTGVDVIHCSSKNDDGLEEIRSLVNPGRTIAFIGSSGVGKSTLINRLMGSEILASKSIREDDGKGRHTTTHRQLLLLPEGGIVIDTPGMRELQIYTGNLEKTFEDVEEISAGCKFNDCSHQGEPGCMVRRAIEEGKLSADRLESYRKLQREMSYDGLSARQLENEKISRMFGSKSEMKQLMKQVKERKNR